MWKHPWVRIPLSPPHFFQMYPVFGMQKYPSGRRGSPAKGVGRETVARVQIPPSAPKSRNNLDIAGCKPTVPRCCGFFICKISEVQKKMPDRNFFIWMDLNSVFQRIENSDGSQRPFSSQKGRPSTEKLYTKNRVPVCWYQKINRPGFFVFRHKRKRAPSPGKDGNSHGQHTAHLFCGT